MILRRVVRNGELEKKMTPSLLGYILAIDALCAEREHVRSVDVAEKLGVARASVCRALDRLSDGGYAVRCESGEVRLTTRGKEIVGKYLPACEVVARALVEKLGLNEGRAEREAVLALGALSDDTVVRLSRLYQDEKEK